MRVTAAILAVCVTACGAPPEAPLEVTFIANAGFMISTPGHRVLVDAVFGVSEGDEIGWAPLPGVLASIEQAAPPFDHLEAVLATHDHLDHFDSFSVARLLANAPDTVFLCPEGLAVALRREAPDVADRVRGLAPDRGSSVRTSVGPIVITALGIPHPGEDSLEFEHVAYLLEMDGRRALHLGDAVADPAFHEPFAWLGEAGLDLAFVPHWLLRDETMVDALRRVYNPRQIIVMHIDPWALERALAEVAAVKDRLSPVHVFREKMEALTIPSPRRARHVRFGTVQSTHVT